jgi:hypothetical protein
MVGVGSWWLQTPFMMFFEVAELGGTFGSLESALAQYRYVRADGRAV